MPTGYTNKIIEGKITEFNDFARLCIRAFGATMHMRDDGLDAEYVPREPSEYYENEIKSKKIELESVKNMDDNELIVIEKLELKKDEQYYLDALEKAKNNFELLSSFLEQAKQYEPPTDDHLGIKKFMISQLEETISYDADTTYYEKNLKRVREELKNLNANVIRLNKIEQLTENIQYYEKQNADEIKRCEDSNKWVEVFFDSLEKND